MSKPIVIMGANGGTGEALARLLDAEGHDIFLTARDPSKLDMDAPSASVDVTQEYQIEAAIAQADSGEGIAGLAYCIGTIDLKPFKSTGDDDFQRALEINLLGAIRALRAAEKSLKSASGSVVLFSTIAATRGFNNHAAISAGKGAVEGLAKTLAAEWAPNVRVNCIAPSLTETELAKPLLSSDQMKAAIEKMHPLPRLGQPEDLAQMAAFLLTGKSTWITGQVLHVDGGRSTLGQKG